MKSVFLFLSGMLMSASAFALECHGTEPFWGAWVTDEKVEFSFTDEKVSVFPVTKVEAAMGMSVDYMSIYSDARGPLAVVTTRECNNGMSDEIFPKEVLIFTGRGVLSGCCE